MRVCGGFDAAGYLQTGAPGRTDSDAKGSFNDAKGSFNNASWSSHEFFFYFSLDSYPTSHITFAANNKSAQLL